MKGWEATALNDLAVLQRGFDITKAQQTVGNIPIISSSGISSFHNKAKCKAPGVVTGRKGTLGKVFLSNVDYWPHDTTLWVKDFKNNVPQYVYYFLQLLKLETYDVGASNPTLNRNHIHKLKILLPPLPIQRKIASILSAYDDLIENNNRRIAILEKMAEELYREWFVRLRFPGHEKVQIVKGVPDGWEVKRIGDITNSVMGQSPASEFYNDRGDGLPFNQGVGTYGKRYPRKEVFCNSKGRIAEKGSILISVRAPVGRLNIADCKMIIGRGLAAFNHKGGYNSYLYYLLRNIFTAEDIIGNGAIFNSVTKDELLGLKFVSPPEGIIIQFDGVTFAIDQEIACLIKKSDLYTATRDRLLTRLMSGKIDVENLDIQFPASMKEQELAEVVS